MLLESWTIVGRKDQKILEEMHTSVLRETLFFDTAFHKNINTLCFLESQNDGTIVLCPGLMAVVLTAAQKSTNGIEWLSAPLPYPNALVHHFL